MYGFLEGRHEEPESFVPYSIEIGFLKRPDSVTNVLAGTIRHQPGSASKLKRQRVIIKKFSFKEI